MKLFSGRYLLPVGRPPLEDGALLVVDGLIVALGPRQELAAAHPGAAAVDFGDCVLLPSMANAHTHLELTDFPAWAERSGQGKSGTDFVDWIRHLVAIRKTCSAAEVRDSLAHGLQASLEAGVGLVGDILTTLPAVPAYAGSLLRGRVFCEVLGHDNEAVAARLAAIARLLPSPADAASSWGLAPHAPYSLSDGAAARVGAFARRHGLQMAIHLAETTAEVEFLGQGRGPLVDRLFPAAGWSPPRQSEPGTRPIAWAGQRNLLDPGSLVVHGVHVDAAGIDLIAANGCSVALCPRSNSSFGEARAPLQAYRQAGVNLALGTDSLASAPSLSIWEELAFAHQWYQGILAPDEWLEIATLGGARAVGTAKTLGSLEPGKEASFQVITAPDCSGPETLCEALCSLGASVQVREHYIAGDQAASGT